MRAFLPVKADIVETPAQRRQRFFSKQATQGARGEATSNGLRARRGTSEVSGPHTVAAGRRALRRKRKDPTPPIATIRHNPRRMFEGESGGERRVGQRSESEGNRAPAPSTRAGKSSGSARGSDWKCRRGRAGRPAARCCEGRPRGVHAEGHTPPGRTSRPSLEERLGGDDVRARVCSDGRPGAAEDRADMLVGDRAKCEHRAGRRVTDKNSKIKKTKTRA